MTVAQRLNIQESEDSLALEELEGWNIAWWSQRNLLLQVTFNERPLIILQNMQAAMAIMFEIYN